MPKIRKKRPCCICHCWFLPDAKVKDRQVTCGDKECQKEQHKNNVQNRTGKTAIISDPIIYRKSWTKRRKMSLLARAKTSVRLPLLYSICQFVPPVRLSPLSFSLSLTTSFGLNSFGFKGDGFKERLIIRGVHLHEWITCSDPGLF